MTANTTWTDATTRFRDRLAAGTPAPAAKAPAKKAAATKKRAR